MKSKKKQSTLKLSIPNRAADMPATIGIVEEFREEMKSNFRAHDRKFDSLEQKIESYKSGAKASSDEMMAEIQRTRMLVEEQNTKTNIVLDGLHSLFGRQERIESRVDEVENTMANFKKVSR